eukprot:TRINITY_DN791_c0_g3_i1.p1 TRINITY_DN791_c0_g3~~TRINITY_DN791_c0_g3_i1.p1  ORF type:complete len:382 (+),score=123.94 TRINITY_DN791_c0_g3_i1:80-1225(+)
MVVKTSPCGTTAYKRVRPDGTVSICGVFFTGGSGVHPHISRPTNAATGEPVLAGDAAYPEALSDDAVRTVASLADTAIAQCKKIDGCEFAATTLKQIADAYEAMVGHAREHYHNSVTEKTEAARLASDADVVPEILRATLSQHEREVAELKKRIQELEAAAPATGGAPAATGPSPPVANGTPNGKPPTTNGASLRRASAASGQGERKSPTANGHSAVAAGALVPAPPASPQAGDAPPSPTPTPRPQRPQSAQPCWLKRDEIAIPRRPISCLGTRGADDLEVRDFELPQLNTQTSHHTSQLAHVYTSSADVRQKFDALDTHQTGYLTFQAAMQYYKDIDDFGVPRSEEQMQRHLRSCFVRGDPEGRMSFEEFELFCLSITKR